MLMLQVRRPILLNTDPHRRCYNGHHYSAMWAWTDWENIASYENAIVASDNMDVFQRINPTREYRIVQHEDTLDKTITP